jgi:uroporphyrinogen-III synthase
MRIFEARVRLARLLLSQNTVKALRNLSRYDLIVFTSKNARQFFFEELQKRHIAPPSTSKIKIVGPRAELLKLQDKNKRRILFPRSAVAPFDIVKQLRKKGAVVRPLLLYTVRDVPVSAKERQDIVGGKYSHLSFRSPSGVRGLLKHFSPTERTKLLKLAVLSIGPTTTAAAKRAGFRRISEDTL